MVILIKNININGTMKMPYFKGLLDSRDPNLKLTFNGLIDLSKRSVNMILMLKLNMLILEKLIFISEIPYLSFLVILKLKL